MRPQDLPEIAIVRVLTAGGPYAVGEIVSVGYTSPTIGRLVAHGPGGGNEALEPGLVPETISACVVRAAPPFATGNVLTLSFVDPRVARIHSIDERLREFVDRSRESDGRSCDTMNEDVVRHPDRDREIDSATIEYDFREHSAMGLPRPIQQTADDDSDESSSFERTQGREEERVDRFGVHADVRAMPYSVTSTAGDVQNSSGATRATERPAIAGLRDVIDRTATSRELGVHVRLFWGPDRVRRFIQVVDKLFTVDRLGWYRHAFTMRLLVPDELSCGDPVADREARGYLAELRAAAVETLGRPLLAAFMPNFVVTSEWLDSLDCPGTARALAGLRASIEPHVVDTVDIHNGDDPSVTTGIVTRRELTDQPASTLESLLPIFIASQTIDATFAKRLGDYRRALIDVFGQTAHSAEAVRLGGMAQPNHALDDRLWQLVGAVGESLGGLTIA